LTVSIGSFNAYDEDLLYAIDGLLPTGGGKSNNIVVPYNRNNAERFIILHDEVVDCVPYINSVSAGENVFCATTSHRFNLKGLPILYQTGTDLPLSNNVFCMMLPCHQVESDERYLSVRTYMEAMYYDS
jgi:hypothetical protein